MKLTLPQSGDSADWKEITTTARKLRNPSWANFELIANMFDFLVKWSSEGCVPYSIDARAFDKIPATIRQEFYNVKSACRDNPDVPDFLIKRYGKETAERAINSLNNAKFKISGDLLIIKLGVDPADSQPVSFLTAARPITSARLSVKSRFEAWLQGDMNEPFEAIGETIDEDDAHQLHMIARPYAHVCVYAITESTVLAKKL
jgi:hypothetical protein